MKLQKYKLTLPQHTAFRFALVGVVNTLFGSSVMFFAYNLLGCSYWFSSAANYVLGSILSYFLNKHFTFQSHRKSWGEMFRFAISIALCYFLAYGVARWATELGLQALEKTLRENISLGVGIVLFVLFNYTFQKAFVFKHSTSSK